MGKAILIGFNHTDIDIEGKEGIHGERVCFLTKSSKVKGWSVRSFWLTRPVYNEVMRFQTVNDLELFQVWDLSVDEKGKFDYMEFLEPFMSPFPKDFSYIDKHGEKHFIVDTLEDEKELITM